MSSGSQSGYECFDELIRQLRVEGYDEPANKLYTLLYEVAWTTCSELLGELGLAILEFERRRPNVSTELRRLLISCTNLIRKVWPNIK